MRGPNYLQDKVKVQAAPAMFHLVAVDMLSFEDPSQRYNLGSRPDLLMQEIERNAAEKGEAVPFTIIVNMVRILHRIVIPIWLHVVESLKVIGCVFVLSDFRLYLVLSILLPYVIFNRHVPTGEKIMQILPPYWSMYSMQ